MKLPKNMMWLLLGVGGFILYKKKSTQQAIVATSAQATPATESPLGVSPPPTYQDQDQPVSHVTGYIPAPGGPGIPGITLPTTPTTPLPGDLGPINWGMTHPAPAVNGEESWSFYIPAGTKSMEIDAVGTSDQTNALLTWTFPDGRVFSAYQLIGGNAIPPLKIIGAIYPFGNIPDQYIPQGRHTLTIRGVFQGYLTVDF